MTSNAKHAQTDTPDTKSPGWTILLGLIVLAVGVAYGIANHWGLAGLSVPLVGGALMVVSGIVRAGRQGKQKESV